MPATLASGFHLDSTRQHYSYVHASTSACASILQNTSRYFQSPLLWLKFCSYLSILCPARTAQRTETKLFVGLQPLLAQPVRGWSSLVGGYMSCRRIGNENPCTTVAATAQFTMLGLGLPCREAAPDGSARWRCLGGTFSLPPPKPDDPKGTRS